MSPKKISLRTRALALLARREHGRLELRGKLLAHAEDEAGLDRLLDELVAAGWLSERRYIEQLAHSRSGRHGSQRIARDLRRKGIAEELVEEALPALRDNDLAAARAVWRRKFGELPRDARERARQTRFLYGRGFTPEIIARVLGGMDED